MDILLTGNLKALSQDFYSCMSSDYHVVTYSSEEMQKKGEERLNQVFESYTFHSVFYFSAEVDGEEKIGNETGRLDEVISLCCAHQVKQMIYVTGNGPKMHREKGCVSDRMIQMEACEEMCRQRAREGALSVMVLRVPFIYSIKGSDSRLEGWVAESIRDKEIHLPSPASQVTDFLNDQDLGRLCARMIDMPIQQDYTVLHAFGDNAMTLEKLGCMLSGLSGDKKRVVYGKRWPDLPVESRGKAVQTEYSWFPRHDVEEEIHIIYEEKKKALAQRQGQIKPGFSTAVLAEKIRIGGEILMMSALAEVLNLWVSSNVLLQFLDFRLLVVVLMGTMNGFTAGLLAAILACLAFLGENLSSVSAQVLFFNIQNWIPFAVYLLVGAVCGYTKDRAGDREADLTEEYDILESKYVFLNGLYQEVLKGKESFNAQIIGYRNSFGRLYQVVKRLDSLMPDKIVLEAVASLEDILENESVAIYTIQKDRHFARLSVCSRSLTRELSKSLDLSEHPELFDTLRRRQLYVNRQLREEDPAFAMPLYEGDDLIGMVAVLRADDLQMNTEFANKFSIITSLISTSLQRAIRYGEEKATSDYIEGTRVYRPEVFHKVLAVRKEMKEKKQADYMLLRVDTTRGGLARTAEHLCSLIRANDILGAGDDHSLYLLLSQTTREDFGYIAPRLEASKVDYQILTEEEEACCLE